MIDLQSNLNQVYQQIAEAAHSVGRDPQTITLVAVSKTQPAEMVAAAYRAGQRHFGENRVEEAAGKIQAVRQLLGDEQPLHWHMVGHLQRRQAPDAVKLFDLVHSVDSLRLTERINRLAARSEHIVPVLLEVNVSGEASKHGFSTDAKGHRALLQAVETMLDLPYVQIRGLMTMAPIVADPQEARPVFGALRQLRDELRQRYPNARWDELSMGMTDDFQVAVQEGATLVRVGRAIFGARR